MQYVAWMKRQFNASQTPRSIYLSVFNSFRIIGCLSQCVSPKIAILPHFCFRWDAPGAITLNVVWIEIEFDAYKLSRSMYPFICNSFPVIRTASAKNRRFHVPQPTFFVSPGDAPAIITQYVAWMERQFNACQTSRNSFRVIRCLSQCVSPKNRYFYHIFVSPGDASGAITLNVVWMEKEFDAYNFFAVCAHLSITVSEIERDIGRKSIFHTPFY